MISKSVTLFCVWVFCFDSVEYYVDGEGNNDQNLTVKISFLCNDPDKSKTFFNQQLSPVYNELSKCLSWSFYPLYIPNPPRSCYNGQIDSLYQCAYHQNKDAGSKLGTFYLCMMFLEEQFNVGQTCASTSEIDWASLKNCNVISLGRQPDTLKTQLTVELNDVTSPEALTNFKKTVCDKLNQMKKSCACCLDA